LYNLEWSFVSRFANLATATSKISAYKPDIPPDSVCPFPTAEVTLRLGDADLPAVERLRIDPATALVCQLYLEQTLLVANRPVVRRTLTQWSYRQTSGPVDESLLAFTPAKKAHRVKSFSSSSDATSGWASSSAPPPMPTGLDSHPSGR
jgi:hypothetical protein